MASSSVNMEIVYILVVIIVIALYISVLVLVHKMDFCMVSALLMTMLVSLGLSKAYTYMVSNNSDDDNRLNLRKRDDFVGSRDYYDNYYTRGMYTEGKEKYEKVGSSKDFELYKQYLKEEMNTPKQYEYPNYDMNPDTTYKVDFRNRQTRRDQKITRYDRKREMDNLFQDAFNTQTNDYFNFYYNTY